MKILKEIIFFLFLFIFSASSEAATSNFSKSSQKTKPIQIEEPLETLREGEKIIFDVFWMGIYVGEGSLEVKERVPINGQEAFHIVAIAKTNDFLSKIYPIYDEIHSFMDTESLRTLEFRKNVREGRYRADERIQYDYAAKRAVYESFKNKSRKEFPLEADVQDFLSAFFWFRLQPAKVGDRIRTKINDEEKDWDLELHILKTEAKELRGEQVLDSFVVEPKTSYKGVFERRGRVWVHFTADAKRVPIWIRMSTPFGPVIGVIKSWTPS